MLRYAFTLAVVCLTLAPALAAQEPPIAFEADSGSDAVTGTADLFLGLTTTDDFHPLGIVSVTWRRFRVEGRYNYEDDRTGSLFAGYEFELGDRPALWVAPMVGAVVGNTDGIAPAVELELTLGRFTLYDESEVVLTFGEGVDDFLYSWGTATYEVRSWLRPGLAFQRLRVFGSDRELDPGLVVQSDVGPLELSLYGFNPFDSDRFFQLGMSVSF